MSSAALQPSATRPGAPALLKPLARAARSFAILLAVLVAAEGLIVAFGVKPWYVPRPSLVLNAILATPQPYIQGFLRTLTETLMGFASGAVFGIAIAVVFFRAKVLKELIFPVFVVSQTIPVIAFGALVVLWFGNTLVAKAAISFYLTFFPVTVNALLGLESVDPRQEALMRSFGASRLQLLTRLQLPAALPQIFVALRLASALSLVGAIVGEWFGDTVGLGVLLLQGMYNENVIAIWAAIAMCAVLGTGFYAVVAATERLFVFWGAEQ